MGFSIFTKEQAKKKIGDLVENFDAKIKFYKSDAYKEAQLEDEYLKPFLRCLNWNVSSEGISSPADREVIVQVKGKKGKEPDYLLQLEGKPCFYIEAKHPKYKLWKETGYIWQAYSYAYSTQSSVQSRKVDFSLLTDFEEFRFFDCTFKPTKNLTLLNNFVSIDWKYTDYIAKFDELWDSFEKRQVKKGSLESRYLDEKKAKANRIPPDKAFLDDLDNLKNGWRIQLAKDIHKFKPDLASGHVTAAVQCVLDRFIFIKVLSDREIEDDYLAQIITEIDKVAIKSEKGILNETCKKLFEKLNQTYNGSIFQKREELDNVSLSNKTLAKILKEFLPENSRYNFKQIPVEILGKIYEQFLGKIVVIKNTRTVIEEKPEVRKAGGVYYTPQYIVDYIVENTVGEKLKECSSIEDIFKVKICDPACGSGSFLIGAYEKLTQWALKFYTKKIKPNQKLTKGLAKNIYLNTEGEVRLSSKLKREILSNCIYGVDIDRQAVELAKTSLSLKMLENTRHDELYEEVTLFHEQVLPNLDDNIKCGNSLIGTDFFHGQNLELFERDEMEKINAFDWDSEQGFGEIMKAGGFDVVIGNPPYVQILHKNNDLIMDYFKAKYLSTDSFKKNMFPLFIEKAIAISLQKYSKISMIIPDRFFFTPSYINTRKLILEKTQISEIVEILAGAFDNAIVGNAIFTSIKPKTENYTISIKHPDKKGQFKEIKKANFKEINRIETKYEINLLLNDTTEKILRKSRTNSFTLKELGNSHVGMMVKNNSEKFHSKKFRNSNPIVKGKQVFKYKILDTSYFDLEDIFIFGGTKDIKKHLTKPKLLLRKTGDTIHCAVDFNGIFAEQSVYLILPSKRYDTLFLCGILNSKIIDFLYKNCFITNPKAYPYIQHYDLEKLPIPKLDLSKPAQKAQHNRMVQLVDQMLDTQKKLHASKTEQDRKHYQQKADILDKQIDTLVYKLYDLTEEEIRIVEDAL